MHIESLLGAQANVSNTRLNARTRELSLHKDVESTMLRLQSAIFLNGHMRKRPQLRWTAFLRHGVPAKKHSGHFTRSLADLNCSLYDHIVVAIDLVWTIIKS